MTSQSSDVEILVHADAPSRVSDDATYRSLAQAYLAFQPAARSHIATTTIPCSAQQPASPSRDKPAHPQPQWSQKNVVAESFYVDSQDISFESVLDNRSSPRLRAKTHHPATPLPTKTRRAASQTVQRQPPSQIADSYPMPDVDVFSITPTRVLQRYLGLGGHARASSSPSKEPAPRPAQEITITSSLPTSDTTNPLSSQEHARIIAGTTIPVTPVAPAAAVLKRKEAPQEEDHDVTHISSSAASNLSEPSTAILYRAESDPILFKRVKAQAETAARSLACNSSDFCATTAVTLPLPPPPPPITSSQIATTHLEIRPPSPETSTVILSPEHLVSPKLAKLAHDLSSRYRPQSPPSSPLSSPRALDPLERGYWLVDCSCWMPETRMDTWSFLTNYLRSGLAGWGVWCRRSEDWSRIKLFGWAHVAKHTYLLLYLASGRAVKMTGAKWMDSDGQVVLVVGPG